VFASELQNSRAAGPLSPGVSTSNIVYSCGGEALVPLLLPLLEVEDFFDFFVVVSELLLVAVEEVPLAAALFLWCCL
jgi:hypothetical protein